MGRLRDRGPRPGHPDAVGGNRHDDPLAVLVEHPQVQHLGEPPAELEHVCYLDAPGEFQRAGAVRGQVASADLGRLDGGFPDEVPPADQIHDLPARLVRAVAQRVPGATRGNRWSGTATRMSMVGVSGVSTTRADGRPSDGTGCDATVLNSPS